jgi:ketosteroid isomerase-like protein
VTVGHDAFAELLQRQFAAGLRVASGEIHRQGLQALAPGLVLEWGQAGFNGVVGEKPVKVMGPYVTIWRRGADGVWRIIRNQSF